MRLYGPALARSIALLLLFDPGAVPRLAFGQQGSCAAPRPLTCDDVVALGEATAGASERETYDCAFLTYPGPDAWFSFQPAADVVATFTLAAPSFDAALVLLEEACEADACLGLADEPGTGRGEELRQRLTAGTTYLVAVEARLPGAGGEFSLALTCCAPDCVGRACGDDGCGWTCGRCPDGEACSASGQCVPSTRSCDQARPLVCGGRVAGDTGNAPDAFHTYACLDGVFMDGGEAVFGFTTDVPDEVTVTLEPGAAPDIEIFHLVGDCAPDACVVGDGLEFVFAAEPGETHYVVVDSAGAAPGPFGLLTTCRSDCVPDCGGSECGSDGCGGVCGECPTGTCRAGRCQELAGCVLTMEPGCDGCPCEACVCGRLDHCCEVEWDDDCVRTCLDECGGCPNLSSCGDGFCRGDETCGNCRDCGCTPPQVCAGQRCCTPNCDGRTCGDDGCGGRCACAPGLSCSTERSCVVADCESYRTLACDDEIELSWQDGRSRFASYGCAEHTFPGPEVILRVPAGLASSLALEVGGADAAADPAILALSASCHPFDGCLAAADATGAGGAEQVDLVLPRDEDVLVLIESRTPNPRGALTVRATCCQGSCEGRRCGDDGCGRACGECRSDERCVNGWCVDADCVPACEGLECGPDGCAGDCGTCEEGWGCATGRCMPPECPDGCGAWRCGCQGVCGHCPTGSTCSDGACVPCEPACAGLECGDDGCGGLCGRCPVGETCRDGVCGPQDCVPDCTRRDCGDDGCGGSCGQCAAAAQCTAGRCETECVPACDGVECGLDPMCGRPCGNCPPGVPCAAGRCAAGVPDAGGTGGTGGAGGAPDADGPGGADGGASCATAPHDASGGGAPATVVLLGALLGFAVARRRRRTPSQRSRAARVVILATAFVAGTGCFDSRVDRSELPCVPGLSLACFTGLDEARGVGACRDGTVLCWEDGGHFFQRCENEVLPSREACNGRDDDCDGVADDDGACHAAAIERFEQDVGPVMLLPRREAETPPHLVAGHAWAPLLRCGEGETLLPCVERLLGAAAPVVGVEDAAAELRFSHELVLAGSARAFVYGQVWQGIPVEDGGLVVLAVGRNLHALLSSVRPVRRNATVLPLPEESRLQRAVGPTDAVQRTTLVWTDRVRLAVAAPPWAAGPAEDAGSTTDPSDAAGADVAAVEPAPLPAPTYDTWLGVRLDTAPSDWSAVRVYVDPVDLARVETIARNAPAIELFALDPSGARPHEPLPPAAPDVVETTALADDLLAFAATPSFEVNGVRTELGVDPRLVDQPPIQIYLGAERIAPADVPERAYVASEGGGCAETQGWTALGSRRIALCSGASAEEREGALTHELVHVLFDDYWDPELTDPAAFGAYHGIVAAYADVFRCDRAGGPVADCGGDEVIPPAAMTAADADGEPDSAATAPPPSETEAARAAHARAYAQMAGALRSAVRSWDAAGHPAADRFRALVHTLLLTFPLGEGAQPLPLAAEPEAVAARLAALCSAMAAGAEAGADDAAADGSGTPEARDCQDLVAAFVAAGVLGPCALPAGEEYCNGFDDNCDGLVDNCLHDCPTEGEARADYTLRRTTYAGPDGTAGHGLCRARRDQCTRTGWAEEISEILPAPTEGSEADAGLCDGADNDCDDIIDDGCPCVPAVFEPRTCGGHQGDEPWCEAGTQVCEPNAASPLGGTLACLAPPDVHSEVCDGRDNDCDGAIDEDPVVGAHEPCAAEALGACAHGESACISAQLVCVPGAPTAPNDGCGNEDLTCDGTLHEDWVDDDRDGFHVTSFAYVCDPPPWDCDDADPMVHPGAMLPCGYTADGDNNCDGVPDEPGRDCICQRQCEGRQCGDDGCGGTCGVCPHPDEVCSASGLCECPRTCGVQACGFDACGHACGVGACPPGQVCRADGSACCDWASHCSGKCGGPDGCDGTCPNDCRAGTRCSGAPAWDCECIPDCAGRACGRNGCGGSCGACPAGWTCVEETGQCTN